jgi:hypothetical protein
MYGTQDSRERLAARWMESSHEINEGTLRACSLNARGPLPRDNPLPLINGGPLAVAVVVYDVSQGARSSIMTIGGAGCGLSPPRRPGAGAVTERRRGTRDHRQGTSFRVTTREHMHIRPGYFLWRSVCQATP